jgi:predicted alpha/beta superfamily hydrolase
MKHIKKIVLLILVVFFVKISQSQVITESIYSEKLDTDRNLKILLPRGYSNEDKKTYPLIVVFDGDYLFEPVAGNIDYYSYWEDIPEAIIVGIKQADQRVEDCMYSEQNSLPVETGADFFEFIGAELIPYIQDTYKVGRFKVAVGHDETANFINYYILKKEPVFNAYITISPDFAPEMEDYLIEQFKKTEEKLFYYLATSTNDVKHIKERTEAFDKRISAIENKNLLYNFNNFEGPSHYALPAHAIPNALESIFFVFQPISKKEYTESILKLDSSPVDYLLEKYQIINDLFGIEKQILINDFKAIAAAIKKKEKFEEFERLGKIARKQYPETLLGNYYLAQFYEKTGEPKKAMRTYRSAYILEEIGGITKDLMLDKADDIKADFGY